MRTASEYCSSTCAVHPVTRLQAKKEVKNSRTIAGASMTSLGIAGESVKDTANEVSALAAYTPWISSVAAVLMVFGVGLVLYARISDARNNPKFNGSPESAEAAD